MNAWFGVVVMVLAMLEACAPRPDVEALRAAVMDADRAFNDATARRGVEGWVSYFEPGGQQFHARGVSVGTDAIRRRMTPAFADTARQLRWYPVRAVVAASGDVGYTIGRWESRSRGADGRWAGEGTGNYVTIWRLQSDGSWKVAVDIGNQDAAAVPADSAKR